MTTTELPIKLLVVGNRKYGLIVGEKKSIVTNSQFIHWIQDNRKPIQLESDWQTGANEERALSEWQERAQPMDLAEFGHYWGIKQRMAANYALLRKSMKEIGVSDEQMPAFGDRS